MSPDPLSGPEVDRLERLLSAAIAKGLSPGLRRAAIPTRWWVVTGTYSAGKTTLLTDLASATGISRSAEPARTYLKHQLEQGNSPAAVWTRQDALILPIHEMRRDLERSLDPSRDHLLDTAIPDTLAYALLYGSGMDEILPDCGLFAYREPIVFLEPLRLVDDGFRREDAGERAAIGYLRSRIYSLLGYEQLLLPAEGSQGRLASALRVVRSTPAPSPARR